MQRGPTEPESKPSECQVLPKPQKSDDRRKSARRSGKTRHTDPTEKGRKQSLPEKGKGQPRRGIKLILYPKGFWGDLTGNVVKNRKEEGT